MSVNVFHKDVLVVGDKLYVALKHVESMEFGTQGGSEDELAATLRGDICIKIVTTSGKEYTVLVSAQMSSYEKQKLSPTHFESDMREFASTIYHKWLNLLSK